MRILSQHSEKDLYDYYQLEGRAGHHQRKIYSSRKKLLLMRKLNDLLKPIVSDRMVLDVGCAEGWYTNWTSKQSSLSVGIDISLPKLRRALVESVSPSTTYVLGSWDSSPFRDSVFNLVLFSEGIEHSIDPLRTLSEIGRVLAKDGLLLISAEVEPDSLYTKLVRKGLIGLKNHFKKPFNGHLWVMTPSLLEHLVGKHFQTEKELLLGTSLDFPLIRTVAWLLGREDAQRLLLLLARKRN